jgi:hypothetical protein
MHQLVREIAGALGQSPETPDIYHSKLEALVAQQGANDAVAVDPESVRSVAQLLVDATALKGKTIRVRGTVVKFNAGILGRNWVHLRDVPPGTPDVDVTVTTAQTAKVGDPVLVEGLLSVNRDFGAGYAYPAIVEDATIRR